MKRFALLVATGFLCVATHASAQGYIFYWIPGLYQFQASFDLTDAEMQPGTDFGSQLFLNSIAITGPDHVVHRWSTNTVDGFSDVASGYFYGPGTNDFVLVLSIFDNASQTVVDARNSTSSMDERSLPDFTTITSENGYWVASPIPEPSAAVLLAVGGAAAWFVKRRRSAG